MEELATHERMIAAPNEDLYGTEAKAWASLLGVLGAAEYNVERTGFGGWRLNTVQIDACRLSVVSEDDQDPLWDSLEPMLSLAEPSPAAWPSGWCCQVERGRSERGDRRVC
ncbi:hypothetical protein AAW14_34900 [Streptomyces hygroscopicus]|nr:hypothetical protein [Streptomyces hygroscopicus]